MCKSRVALLAALALGGLPALASAQTVDATALTLLSGRQDPRDGVVHTVVPAYEQIWLSARDLTVPGVEDLRIVVQGWGMLSSGETMKGEDFTGDLDIAYVEGKLLDRQLALRAGRQLVSAGVARNLQLDGLVLLTRLPLGLGVQAYGGVPVSPRFGYARGQGAVGGRVFWRPAPRFEGGVSFVHLLDDGKIDRQEAGVDARLLAGKKITLTGFAAFSTVEQRLAEATLRALWQPRRNLELTLEAGRTAPDLFVSRASIFSVFAEESRNEGGATLYFRPWTRLRLWGDGFVVNDDGGTGGRAGLRASLALDADNAALVGIDGRVLALPDSRYVLGRVYGLRRFGRKVTATLEGEAVWLDPEINGQDLSLTCAATIGWDFLPGWKALATGLVGQTPLLESRFEAMAKLVYNFDYTAHKVTP